MLTPSAAAARGVLRKRRQVGKSSCDHAQLDAAVSGELAGGLVGRAGFIAEDWPM